MSDIKAPTIYDVPQPYVDVVLNAFWDTGRSDPEEYEDHKQLVACADLDGVVIATV